jgi:hypothetical protein
MGDRRPAAFEHLPRALKSLSTTLRWPDDSGLAPAVAERLRRDASGPAPAVPRVARSQRHRRLLVAVAVAAGLAILAAAVARVSIGAIGVREDRPPSSPPPLETRIAFGSPTSLDAAAAALGGDVLLPRRLGPPDAVFLDRPAEGTVRVTAAWRPRPGLPVVGGIPWGAVLSEIRGDAEVQTKTLFSEVAPDGGPTIRRASVDGSPAYWLSGDHELDVLTPAGERRFLVHGNVLLWEGGALTFRLETALPEPAAMAIASATT